MPNLIAIAFADLHAHKFRSFDKPPGRLYWCLDVLREIADIAADKNVDVLFAGDLLHNPKEVENQTMSKLIKTYNYQFERRGVLFLAISGNHDMSEKNSIDHQSPSHLHSFDHFKTFECIDNDWMQCRGYVVAGIPYYNNDKDVVMTEQVLWKKVKDTKGLKILLVHGDFPGAKTNTGYRVKETEYLNHATFKNWDLVLSGHIHKRQQLAKNMYMLGAPLHIDTGDIGNKCGYWKIYDDATVQFKELIGFPRFTRETPKNPIDYYVAPEQLSSESEVKLGEFSLLTDRTKLARKYCALKNIKSKAKKRALIEILNNPE